MASSGILFLVFTLTCFINVCEPNTIKAVNEQLPHSYEVSIRFVNRHFCGGAIIGPQHILTAAHCFYQNGEKYPDPMYKYMSVVSGFNADLSQGGKIHRIKNVTTQEDIPGPQDFWISDIALVTLQDEIAYSPLEQPIDLPLNDLLETGGAKMSIWSSPVDNLQTTEVNFIPHSKCAERLKEKFLGEHDRKICGYTRAGRGFCLNNSGSPLVQNGRLAGIASTSEGCRNGTPDVYTNVYQNLHFIEKAITGDLT